MRNVRALTVCPAWPLVPVAVDAVSVSVGRAGLRKRRAELVAVMRSSMVHLAQGAPNRPSPMIEEPCWPVNSDCQRLSAEGGVFYSIVRG
jgi:hypothetical protein